MTMQLFSIQTFQSIDLSQDTFPAQVQTWQQATLSLTGPGTHFGFIFQGQGWLHRGDRPSDRPFPLDAGMYFCLPENGILDGTNAVGIVITCPNHHGVFSLGGPIEASGRLAYINGGTNSVLIPPPLVGNPCLNAMYLPPHIEQALHTHSSYRIGMVVSGIGHVETLESVGAMARRHSVKRIAPGDTFLIPAEQEHRFCTGTEGLSAVVFHPDSEAGFSHRDNPMLQRTLVDGVSAAALPHLQTPVSRAKATILDKTGHLL